MEIVAEKKVKTRKSHNCWGCMGEIPPGTEIQTVTSKDGGVIATVYWGDRCQSFMDTLDSYDRQDGFAYGELSEDDRYPK